ncbi:MAG TPA: tRNA pseudouridine(38-40) synthase TruA [Syntrophobacteraceae bacterium]|nr:tRNA pseudouridine(38-40) synthase TruA [Syntrophobacteraceae bacterium]
MDVQAKRNFRLVLEYDGTNYHGWQRQHGMLTVQEAVESRLEIMLGNPIKVRASGRTDAGVHARAQEVNFYARTRLQPVEIQRGLNALLPDDIVILAAVEVEDSFHARFSARSKIYEYRILNRPVRSALERHYAWHIRRPLAIAPMLECLGTILGEHDFAAFMASGSEVRSTVRCLYRAELLLPDADHLLFVFEGNGFLRQMVRNLVGTIVEVGKGRLSPEDVRRILSSRDRRQAGMTAPARGLSLVRVVYPDEEVGIRSIGPPEAQRGGFLRTRPEQGACRLQQLGMRPSMSIPGRE